MSLPYAESRPVESAVPLGLAAGALAAAFVVPGSYLSAALLLGVGVVAAACAVVDARESRVPNQLVLIGVAMLGVRILGGWLGAGERLGDLVAAASAGLVTGGAALLFVMWLVRPALIGGGDWKLLAVIGASLGIVDTRAAFVALAAAVTMQMLLLVALRRSVLPFAPALAIGHCVGALSAWWLHTGVGALR